MKVINLFAGPGAGKSTLAAGVFSRMKLDGYNIEYVQEYAKDLVWAQRTKDFGNQLPITAEQHRRLWALAESGVEWAVTDSPLLLGLLYAPLDSPPSLRPLIWELWNRFDNRNFVILRNKPYVPLGRNEDEDAAKTKDAEVSWLLKRGDVSHVEIEYGDNAPNEIIKRATRP